MYPFQEFHKIPRLKREVVITEKIDGTNAQIAWVELDEALLSVIKDDEFCLGVHPGIGDGSSPMGLYAGSRSRWLKPGNDNYGFCAWVLTHAEELRTLGPGRHFGEWWGLGIQRGYDCPDKRFSLFNVGRWNPENPNRPACCSVVPILARGDNIDDDAIMRQLDAGGSVAAPGFKSPEGIIIYHSAAKQYYKRTFRDDGGKWKA